MGSVAVTIRLLETIAAIAAQAVRADDLAALREHVEEIRARSTAVGRDRLDVEDRAEVALEVITRREQTIPPAQEPAWSGAALDEPRVNIGQQPLTDQEEHAPVHWQPQLESPASATHTPPGPQSKPPQVASHAPAGAHRHAAKAASLNWKA